MPGQSRHRAAAELNERIALALLSDARSCSWAIVLAFYAALHWVDAYLARSLTHPGDHVERDGYVRRPPLRRIYDDYRTVSDRSKDVRYLDSRFSQDEARALIDGELARIKAHVHCLL